MVGYIYSLQVHYGKPGLQEVATFARCVSSSLTFPKKREKYQNVCILQAGQPSSHDGNIDRRRLPRYSQVKIFANSTDSDCLWLLWFFVAAVVVLVCSSTSLPHGALHVCPCCQSSEKRAPSSEGRSPLAPWVLQIHWSSSSYKTFPVTRVSLLVMEELLSDTMFCFREE